MGIKHFHALSNKRKQEFLNYPDNFVSQEKLDGSNIIVGATNGDIWLARKTTEKKYFKPEDWGNAYWTTNFREVHEAVMNNSQRFIQELGRDFEIEGEILSQNYPNTLLYENAQGINNVVFFRYPDNFLIYSMARLADVPETYNGITTEYVQRDSKWCFSTLYTSQLGGMARGAINEAKVIDDPDMQAERLLRLVRYRLSDYGHTRPEGIVYTHVDGWQFKVVDREWFTATNANNYAWRKKLFKTPGQKTNSVMDRYTRNISSGMSISQASDEALTHLSNLLIEYLAEPKLDMPTHVNTRNLEAFASLRMELENGR